MTTQTKKLAIFDPTDRIESEKGILIKDLFEKIEGVTTEIFAVKYNHFPIENNPLSLEVVDADLEKNGKKSKVGEGKHPPVDAVLNYLTKNYDGLVIGGNNDHQVDDDTQEYFDTLYPLMNELIKIDYPVLGICWGAQAIMRALHGDDALAKMTAVGKEPQIGVLKYTVIKKGNPLFEGVSDDFYSLSFHKACFIIADPSAKIICSRDGYWDNQAFQFKKKRCFGVQFHPEHTLASSTKTFNKFKSLSAKDKGDFANSSLIYDKEAPDEDQGKKIAQNFLNIIDTSSFEAVPISV
ncbi:hypothetical protein AKO1_003129 [Acrasis kona]|uniref:GMP synthase n=1 Tax=Acrasis kona TaxID=1008807 RepID=A0AAW2YMG5_9EUKA